jgi:hypothetical protein
MGSGVRFGSRTSGSHSDAPALAKSATSPQVPTNVLNGQTAPVLWPLSACVLAEFLILPYFLGWEINPFLESFLKQPVS